ncbi:S8 family serine peptidase [Spirosoma sp. BT702]|uniref:S8 family serine peptidase n=1 Tax=Spirosoma profusum TaxID=2771354 RepID=A0A927ATU5_9BACT|nr:S8 family serine peptidase [Spirosoma profusum]MBD2701127.1 S8 family serine peptidase [Spirosoma profusum]
MNQRLWKFFRDGWATIGLVIATFASLRAQSLPQYNVQQRVVQKALQQSIEQQQTENYRQALAEAQRLKRPIFQQSPSGRVVALRGISERGELLYDATNSTTKAAQSTRTNALYAGGSLGVSLSGSTLTDKLAIWDGGKVRNTHIEFRTNSASRVTQADGAATLSAHSTHVAGIMIAAGVNTADKGMAFGTNLRAYDFNQDANEMSSAGPNLLISNHSYGSNAGWVFSDSRTTANKWEWWGDTTVSNTEDYKFGVYNSTSVSWDRIAVASPYYLIVKSSGNNRGSNGPGAGQPYFLGVSDATSTAPRNSQNGYDLIPTYGTAKNILTVGAINNLNFGYNYPTDVIISDFSSWGPTDDGRIKPDIVGVGVNVLSSTSENDSAYTSLSGTSMSSPNVAGSLLLLQELFSQRNSGRFLRSSTLKGLAIHTADEAGNTPGPDYQNGWGLLNIERAGRLLLNSDQSYLLDEKTLAQSEVYSLTVVASGRGPLMSTICWTDPVGMASSVLNDRTPKLVNDLDIRITDGKTTTLPWILNPDNPSAAATRGDNIRDNVEQVLIADPTPGKSYTITVTHKNTLNGSKQDYALLVSGIGGTAYCASAATSTSDTKINRVQFGSINQIGADGCTSYTDFSQVKTSVQASQQIPLTVSLGTCGATKNVVVKAFADWNQNGTFDDAGETLATSDVLPNSGQFAASVTIPASVQQGQFIRLRIVATETDNATSVSACGTYGNGETQDYVLNVVQTNNDVGATSLISPGANFCGQTSADVPVSVRVRNFGSVDQANVPVSIQVTDVNNTNVASLTGVVTKLLAFRESSLTLSLPAGTTLSAGQTYRFAVTTSLSSDQNPANNSLITNVTTSPAPAAGLFSAASCGSDTAISLRNTSNGTAFWYDAPIGGNLIAAGNQISVKTLPTGRQFYATLNDFSGTLGPVDKKAFGGGTYSNNFGPAPIIATTVPIVLESARLYIGNAGQLTFTVRRYDNTAISSVTLDVVPTRNQNLTATTNNQLVDDPDDQGAVYPLNLKIPQAGEYKITIEFANGASIFRSNVGVNGFPYQLKTQSGQPVVTSKGALFANGSTNDTLKTAWYYFYNLRVRSLDCPSLQRTAVSPVNATSSTASITPSGSASFCQGASLTLQANTGNGLTYQWYRNGQIISGATSNSLQAATSGSYAVDVASVCPAVRSSAVTLTSRTAQMPTVTVNGGTLTSNAVSSIQWLINGVPIPGATSTTYIAGQSGRYSVKGNVNGCGELVSDEVAVTILAAEPLDDKAELNVYPNPATKQIIVSLSITAARPTPPTLRLTDVRGLTVRQSTLQRDGKTYQAVVDISDLPGGTFFVVVDDERTEFVRVKRIQKH